MVIGSGSHPFPFRTRKLSLIPPMVLHGKLCGRVGRCRHYLDRPDRENGWARFLYAGTWSCHSFPCAAWAVLFSRCASLNGRVWESRSLPGIISTGPIVKTVGPVSCTPGTWSCHSFPCAAWAVFLAPSHAQPLFLRGPSAPRSLFCPAVPGVVEPFAAGRLDAGSFATTA